MMAGYNAYNASAMSNTLAGGAGDDLLVSGSSADTYLFNRGDGRDLIVDYDATASGKVDKVVFCAGIAASDLTVSRSGNNLVAKIGDPQNPAAGDQLTIDSWGNNTSRIEQFQFADGAVWTAAQMNIASMTGTGGADLLTAWFDSSLIDGKEGNDTMNGGTGNGVMQGGNGIDTLTDTSGNNLLNGGAGNDSIVGGAGNEFIIGGAGNDYITTGAGWDVITFDRGDGQDTVMASAGRDNTLSLGKGIVYADLSFAKTGSDLIFSTGGGEQVTFKDWYASANNHSVANLQMLIEDTADYDATSLNNLNSKKIVSFNFDGLVTQFDQARGANPEITNWTLSSALLNFYLNSEDTAAIGGDLAYQYAKNGNMSNLSLNPALAVLGSAQFGGAPQSLQGASVLQDMSARLM